MKIHALIGSALAMVTIPALSGCGEAGQSHVRVTAADASALRQALGKTTIENYDSIRLNVSAIRVRIDADDDTLDEAEEGEGSGSWYDLSLVRPPEDQDAVQEEPDRYVLDLVQLVEGGEFDLAEGEVPAGVLTQIRFVLDANDPGTACLASDPTNCTGVLVPSGSQSGLKLVGGEFVLEPQADTWIRLEFDAEASLHEHHDGRLRIRPVIHISGATSENVPVDGSGGKGGDETGTGGTGGDETGAGGTGGEDTGAGGTGGDILQ